MVRVNDPRRRFWVSAIAATLALRAPLKAVEGTMMPAYEISDDAAGAASAYAWYGFERSQYGFRGGK